VSEAALAAALQHSTLAGFRELHRAWALVHQGGCRAARACIILDHLVKRWWKMLVRLLI
jgi:hypothetical protein